MPVIKADDLAEDLEDHPVPEGNYNLTIKSAKYGKNKSGKPMITLGMKIDGEDAPLVNEYLTIYEKGEEHYRMGMRNLKRVFAAFGVDGDFDPETDTENLLGCTAQSILLVIENGDDGVDRNRARWPKT